MKTKILLVALLCISITNLQAQNKATKKTKKNVAPVVQEDVMGVGSGDVDMVVDAESFESTRTSRLDFVPVSTIRYNNAFQVYSKINDQYDYYCERNASDKEKNLGIADKNGNVILPHLFSKRYDSYGNSIILYSNNNYGLFSLDELRWTIPMEYEDIYSLSSTLFIAKKKGIYGVIDANNKIIVPFEWSQLNSISGLENYVTVTSYKNQINLKGVYSIIERKLAIPCVYTSLQKLSKQNYFSCELASKHNIIDINNVPRFKKWYDEIIIPSSGRNYYIVKANNLFGVIDDSEKEIIPIEYLEFASSPFSDGSYLARNKENKYGFISIDGKITMPFIYDNLKKRSYYDNVISMQNGKCGLVQINAGTPYEITTCDFDDIKGNAKTFIVEKNGKFGLLDLYGKNLTEVEFESIESYEEKYYETSIFKVNKKGSYHLLDEQGKIIGEDNYVDYFSIPKKSSSYYSSYEQKISYLKALSKNGKYSIVDKVGKTLTKPLFDEIESENDNIFIVKSHGKTGIYSLLDQKLLVDYKYESIIKTKDYYMGMIGNKIDLLILKSGEMTVINTTSSNTK